MSLKFNVCSLILFISCLSFSQKLQTLKGNITNFKGNKLSYVKIINKQSSEVYVSNKNGEYLVKVKMGTILIFDFLGYEEKEIRVDGKQKTLNVKLKNKTEKLEEVVVTAYGIKREKKSMGAASFTIKAKELNNSSQTTIAKALKGKISGGIISSSSSSPGASSGIILRGINSLNSSNQPLIIVDGSPINNFSTFSNDLNGSFDFGRGIDDINPEDIESITVVKGSSETALYGARAANGVINITTKKGSEEKISVDFSSILTLSNVLKAPKYQNTFGQGFGNEFGLSENVSWGPALNGQVLPWGNTINGNQLTKPFTAQKNHLENFYNTGIEITKSAAVYGGNDLMTGRLSISNRNSDGINPGKYDTNERNTLNASFKTKVNNVDVGGDFNFINTKGRAVTGGQGFSVINNLLQIPVDINVKSLEDLSNPFNSVSNYFTAFGVVNPYFSLKNRGTKFKEKRFYGSFYVDFKINDLLNFKYRYGIDNDQQKITTFGAKIKPEVNTVNFGRINDDGFYSEATIDVNQINHDFILSFDKKYNKSLSSSSTFGVNINQKKSEVSSLSVSTQDIFGYYAITNSTNAPDVGVNSILGRAFLGNNELVDGDNKRKLYGVFGTTTFNYKDRFFVTGNLRNDWTSTLPAKNRSILYGGINSAWIFSETFSLNNKIINYGKLRVGYGETGLDTSPYRVFSELRPTRINNQGFRNFNFPTIGINSYEVGNRAENLNLKAERRKEIEIGTELLLFKNRIGLDFTYYYALTEDQILNLPLSPSTGYSFQTANIGVVSNEGVELALNINWIHDFHGFKWNSSFNYAKANSILKELDDRIDKVVLEGLDTTTLIAVEGEKIGLLEGSVPKLSPEGGIIVGGDGIPIAASEKEIYGDTQYDYTLGITNNFRYKNVALSFTLDSRQGGLMFSRIADITHFTGNSIATTQNNREAFIVPNSVVEVTATDGSLSYVENTTPVSSKDLFNYYTSEALKRTEVIDKSFVKLREVALSYKLKNIPFSKKITLKELSISLIGRNLMIWTPSENQFIDPEVSSFGTDLRGQFGEYGLTPNTKSFSFSVKAHF